MQSFLTFYIQIANHGYTHANWSALDTEGLRLEVQKLDDALLSIIGEKYELSEKFVTD